MLGASRAAKAAWRSRTSYGPANRNEIATAAAGGLAMTAHTRHALAQTCSDIVERPDQRSKLFPYAISLIAA